jgi:hypothetical protein
MEYMASLFYDEQNQLLYTTEHPVSNVDGTEFQCMSKVYLNYRNGVFGTQTEVPDNYMPKLIGAAIHSHSMTSVCRVRYHKSERAVSSRGSKSRHDWTAAGLHRAA